MALKDLSQRTKEELSQRVADLERLISKKGLGSNYVAKVEKIQRRVNIVLFLGVATTIAGLFTWMALKSDQDED